MLIGSGQCDKKQKELVRLGENSSVVGSFYIFLVTTNSCLRCRQIAFICCVQIPQIFFKVFIKFFSFSIALLDLLVKVKA
jgi:hypothetical protein